MNGPNQKRDEQSGCVHLFKYRSGLNTYLIAVCINPEGTFDVIYNALEIHVWHFRQSESHSF